MCLVPVSPERPSLYLNTPKQGVSNMSKRKKKLFIQIHHDFYDSKEWKTLHWYSKLAYLRIKRKYNPNNGDQVSVSYREMTDEMTQKTYGKAIKELLEEGFIEVVQKGGLYRRRNYYTLSYRWKTLKASSPPKIEY